MKIIEYKGYFSQSTLFKSLLSCFLRTRWCGFAIRAPQIGDLKSRFKQTESKSIKETPESRRDWLVNLFWFAGKNDKKINYYKDWQGMDAKEILNFVILFLFNT